MLPDRRLQFRCAFDKKLRNGFPAQPQDPKGSPAAISLPHIGNLCAQTTQKAVIAVPSWQIRIWPYPRKDRRKTRSGGVPPRELPGIAAKSFLADDPSVRRSRRKMPRFSWPLQAILCQKATAPGGEALPRFLGGGGGGKENWI